MCRRKSLAKREWPEIDEMLRVTRLFPAYFAILFVNINTGLDFIRDTPLPIGFHAHAKMPERIEPGARGTMIRDALR